MVSELHFSLDCTNKDHDKEQMDINNHKQLVVTSNKEADKIKQFHNYNNERLPKLKQGGDVDSG